MTGEEPKLIAINGEPINKTGKYNLDGKYRLTIYDVSLEDAGEYIYTAKLIIPDNELGLIFETSVSANLTVRGKSGAFATPLIYKAFQIVPSCP